MSDQLNKLPEEAKNETVQCQNDQSPDSVPKAKNAANTVPMPDSDLRNSKRLNFFEF